jgi:hypothetical protein
MCGSETGKEYLINIKIPDVIKLLEKFISLDIKVTHKLFHEKVEFFMKKLFITLIFLLTTSIYAGDLHVNCFLNEDEGAFIKLSDAFMGTDKIALPFEYKNYSYLVLVTRDSLFCGYHYEIIKINKNNMNFQKFSLIAEYYSDVVRIDSKIQCVTND